MIEYSDIVTVVRDGAAAAAAEAYDAMPTGEEPTAEAVFMAMAAAKAKLKEAIEHLDGAGKELQARILDEWLSLGVSSQRFDTGTLGMRSQLWPIVGDAKERVISALKDNGHADLVSEGYNANAFASMVREHVNAAIEEARGRGEVLLPADAVPDWLKNVGVSVSLRQELRVTKR